MLEVFSRTSIRYGCVRIGGEHREIVVLAFAIFPFAGQSLRRGTDE